MTTRSCPFAKALIAAALVAAPAWAQTNPFDAPPKAPAEAPAAAPATGPFVGTFADNQMSLTLERDPANPIGKGYKGTITKGNATFPVIANEVDGKLAGKFTAGANAFPFTATIENGTVTFTTGASTYKLAAAGAPAVPGVPGPAFGPGPGPAAPVEPAAAPKPGGIGVMLRMMEDNVTLRVMGVKPSGPAAKAGVQEGDAIVAVDGKDIRGQDPGPMLRGNAGTPVRLTLDRNGQRVEVVATREAMEFPQPQPGGPGAPEAPAGGQQNAGVGINLDVNQRGVFIQDTVPNGPAARAGIRPGDQIVAIDGKPLRSVQDLAAGLPGAAGTPIKLTIARGGQNFDVDMKREVTNAPAAPANPAGPGPDAPAAANNAGVGIHLNVTAQGVFIQETIANGPAARAGLAAGDQILAIDGQALRNVQDLQRLTGAPGSAIRLTMRRGNQTGNFDLKREVTTTPPPKQ